MLLKPSAFLRFTGSNYDMKLFSTKMNINAAKYITKYLVIVYDIFTINMLTIPCFAFAMFPALTKLRLSNIKMPQY